MHMKHTSLLIGFALLLSACGGGDGATADCDTQYWDEVFGTCLPSGWVVVDKETMDHRGIPEETIVAFRAEEAVSGQFPTVTVTAEPLSEVLTPQQYSEASIRMVSVLPGYTIIDKKDVEIDGEIVSLHTFSAQPIDTDPARRFYQLSTVLDTKGFTITGTVPLFVEDSVASQIVTLLENTTFLAPEE